MGSKKPDDEDVTQDPELQKLLNKLGNKNPLPGAEVPANQQPIEEIEKEQKALKKVEPAKTKEAKEPKAEEKKTPKGTVVTRAVQEDVKLKEDDQSKELSERYKGIISQYSDVASATLTDLNKDRKRILRAIRQFREVVEGGGKVPRAYIEGWVASLSTLSDTNGHKVKLLDSFAKFMAAGKNSEIFNNLAVNLDTETLSRILDADRYPDEDR